MTSIESSATELRVAVIGLGRMGMRHVQAVQRLGMQICGLADMAKPAVEAAAAASRVGPDACFTDARDMLRATRPAAVVVATTAPSHAVLVETAVRNGARYVLCEKPMAVSLAESAEMIDYCAKAGVALAINHQMRFMPQYVTVKSLIGGDELGPLASILIAGSNFGLAMNASHYFEMFRYLSDSRVRAVQAWFEEGQVPNPRGISFEDRAGRLLAWGESGVPMYIDFSMRAGHGVQVVYVCRNGQITLDEISCELRIEARKREFRDLPTTRYCMPSEIRRMMVEPADIVVATMEVWSAMLEGRSFPNGADGAHAMTCVVAAHVSHEAGGCEIRLSDPSLPFARTFKWA